MLREAREQTGLPIVTEVMSTEDVDLVSEYADMLQVGARNMQNFPLLRRLSRAEKPILLKRSPSATVKEWLLAAEYLLSGGNPNVVLCERGIKTFESELRNTFDLAAIALAKELSHLPVVADPSHGTGRRSVIPSMSRAAIAANGMIEVCAANGSQAAHKSRCRFWSIDTVPARATMAQVAKKTSEATSPLPIRCTNAQRPTPIRNG